MKQKLKKFLYALSKTRFAPIMRFFWDALVYTQMHLLKLCWFLSGAKKPSKDQRALMKENVTFLFKSFQRQSLAKKLYKNIQRYYPGIQVIIVDDSRTPLTLSGPGLTVVQLPFNQGLGAGLNAGLALVNTPFVVRMDDDELLTPRSNFHKQLEFLLAHPEIDLVGILPKTLPLRTAEKGSREYAKYDMARAPKPLTIPHGTKIDENHTVLGKVPNIFIARTEKYRSVGYDDNIKVIDHHEFFFRAAGNMVSVLDSSCFVLHMHEPFDTAYQAYRTNIAPDKQYIAQKHAKHIASKSK